MSAYIRSLQAGIEREHATQAAQAEAVRLVEAQAVRARLTPLEERLARLLSTFPDDVRREGLSLPKLAPMLRGRWRATADAGQVGTALRKLGWRRERRWRGADLGFSALWFPPAR